MRKLRAAWGDDMSEDLGGTPVRKPPPDVQTTAPTSNTQVATPTVVTPRCDCSCMSSDRRRQFMSQQDIDDEEADSWNGWPLGTTRRMRETNWR
jgi:hypothetical protein